MRISDWSSDVCSSDLHDYRCTGLLAEEYSALGFDREFRSAASRSLRQVTDEVRCHPEDADAWAFGSTLLVELGERLRGEEWANRAVIIGPDDYLVHYNVSRTHALDRKRTRLNSSH